MENFLEALSWVIMGLIFSILFHFLWLFVSKKHKKEKLKFEELKKSNPNESYSQKEYFIAVTGAYVNGLYIARYIFIIFAILILVRYLLVESVSEPIEIGNW